PMLGYLPESIHGTAKVEYIALKNVSTGESTRLPVDGVFIFVGYDPQTGIVPDGLLDSARQVKVNMHMCTPLPGLFAAGDIRSESMRQIVMACADGATAAMSAYEYIAKGVCTE
ncbi:MAG: NAD(P)/FAD-dependent oxidoreductase, partial [Spirochaetota bacterium]